MFVTNSQTPGSCSAAGHADRGRATQESRVRSTARRPGKDAAQAFKFLNSKNLPK